MENEEVKQPEEITENKNLEKGVLGAALAALAGTSLFSTTRSAPITINVHVGDKTVYHGTNATPV